MSFFSNLFAGRTDPPEQSASEGRGTRAADTAIRDARAGRIPVPQMLQSVVAAQIYVPLAGPPVMEGDKVGRWNPATVTKQMDGSRFLVAFTDAALMAAFSKSNPQHSFAFLIDASWVLGAIPSGHGIAFNVGGDNAFEWSADGISAYKAKR